jgi:hypothetical protein
VLAGRMLSLEHKAQSCRHDPGADVRHRLRL